MASGTFDRDVARADRIREQSAKDQRVADMNRRARDNAVAALRGTALPEYREEMDSEVTVNTGVFQGSLKGVPRFALGAAIVVVAIAAAIVAVLRFWPR